MAFVEGPAVQETSNTELGSGTSGIGTEMGDGKVVLLACDNGD